MVTMGGPSKLHVFHAMRALMRAKASGRAILGQYIGAEGGKKRGSMERYQMLKSVARLGATLLSICAELRALRREAQLSGALQKLCFARA